MSDLRTPTGIVRDDGEEDHQLSWCDIDKGYVEVLLEPAGFTGYVTPSPGEPCWIHEAVPQASSRGEEYHRLRLSLEDLGDTLSAQATTEEGVWGAWDGGTQTAAVATKVKQTFVDKVVGAKKYLILTNELITFRKSDVPSLAGLTEGQPVIRDRSTHGASESLWKHFHVAHADAETITLSVDRKGAVQEAREEVARAGQEIKRATGHEEDQAQLARGWLLRLAMAQHEGDEETVLEAESALELAKLSQENASRAVKAAREANANAIEQLASVEEEEFFEDFTWTTDLEQALICAGCSRYLSASDDIMRTVEVEYAGNSVAKWCMSAVELASTKMLACNDAVVRDKIKAAGQYPWARMEVPTPDMEIMRITIEPHDDYIIYGAWLDDYTCEAVRDAKDPEDALERWREAYGGEYVACLDGLKWEQPGEPVGGYDYDYDEDEDEDDDDDEEE